MLFYLRKREPEGLDASDWASRFEQSEECRELFLLSKAMAALDLENRAYNRSVLEQGQRLEDISLLDDIKRIKQAMRQEVEQLREAVREKELRDSAKIEKLSRKVSVLNHELQSARSESEHDGLTGILNRRTFDRLLGDLVARNTVTPQEFALLMIDIDNFKHINDTFGHLAGDGVIVALVNKLRQSIRSEDMLARYGGEEFVIILPGASLRNAMKKARKVCEAVAAKRYVLEGVPASQMFELTVSIGVSAWRPGDTASSVVERADQALYFAKRSGKNRAESEKSLKHCT